MKRATLLLGLLLALTGAVAGTAGAADATPAATVRMPQLDAAVLSGLNATRAAHGLRPLVVSAQLENAAVAHSRAMLEGGFFAHDSRDGTSFIERVKHFYKTAGSSSWSAGENLIYNTAALDAGEAIRVWLDSPPHRANMLDPKWREVGIGSLHAASAGGTYGGEPTWVITMDFGTRVGASPAAKPVAAPMITVAREVKKPKKNASPAKPVKPKQAFTPPRKNKTAKPKQAKAAKQPAKEKKKKKKKKKKKVIVTLPVPAPSYPVPTSPDAGATQGDDADAALLRHHGDDGQEESASADDSAVDHDPGTAPAEPVPAP